MASATVQGGQKFPESTVLAAYPASGWPLGSPEGAPVGSSAGAATVTNGVALFTGLASKTRYYAYALVSSEHRYVQFTTSDLTVAREAARLQDRDNGQAGMYAPSSAIFAVGAVALAASRAYAMRFVPSRDMTIGALSFFVLTAAAADDACDVGIFSGAGARMVSKGATAGLLNSIGRKAPTITPTVVRAGTPYYAAFSCGTFGGAGATISGAVFAGVGNLALFGTAMPQLEGDVRSAAHPLADPWGTLGSVSSSLILLSLLEA